MSFRRLGAAAALATTTAVLLTGCGSSATPAATAPSPEPAKLAVVASTNVYGSIAAAVGGDRVQVTSLINDPSADPHAFEATPTAAAEVGKARVVVYNGGGYDDFVGDLVKAAPAADRAVVDVTDLSGLEKPEEFNEHVWYSLPTVQKLVTALATEFGKADPDGASTYQQNATAFATQVTDLEKKTTAIADKHQGERVAVTEPVPGYLIEAAGLTDATPHEFSEAVEEDTDPPAAVVAETLALFTTNPVKVLLLNDQTETPTTDQVKQAAQTAKVPVVEVSETLPAGTTDYVTWMGGQIDALATALG